MQTTLRPPSQTGLPMAASVGSPSHPLWQFDNQNQPPAGTESASIPTKTIAQFTHIYRDPITPFNAPHLRRFCEPSLNSIGLGVVAPVGLNASIVELQIHDGSTIVNVSMQLDADSLETAARHFLDAAHHLRQQASQGGAA